MQTGVCLHCVCGSYVGTCARSSPVFTPVLVPAAHSDTGTGGGEAGPAPSSSSARCWAETLQTHLSYMGRPGTVEALSPDGACRERRGAVCAHRAPVVAPRSRPAGAVPTGGAGEPGGHGRTGCHLLKATRRAALGGSGAARGCHREQSVALVPDLPLDPPNIRVQETELRVGPGGSLRVCSRLTALTAWLPPGRGVSR